jgi:hypothetical protein
VRKRMIQALIFLLAGWPLLLPSGMCICQLAHAVEASASACDDDDCPDHPGDHQEHNAPTDQQHPVGCPASKKADFRGAQRQNLVETSVTLPALFSSSVGISQAKQPYACADSSSAPSAPIYLALCTFLI